MRILLANALFPRLGIGGSEVSTYFLAQGLIGLGHDVLVFSQNVEDFEVEEIVDGVPVVRVASRAGTGPNIFAESHYRRLAAAAGEAPHPLHAQFADVVGSFRPDVVHTAVIGRLSQLWDVAKRSDATLVHTLRSYASLCGRRMMTSQGPCDRQCRDCAATRVAARDGSGIVDGVVGISRHVLDVHLRAGWFRSSTQKRVIANSYETSAPFEEPAGGGGAEEGVFEFGYIGRLHPTKGIELFLDALAELRRETGRPLRALVAGTGDGSYERALKRRYQDPDTQFVGHVPPSRFFGEVRFCVAPSIWYEPFGRVIIESLHHRRPVIGSRRGGGAEILEDGLTGWLFEPDPASMKARLRLASEIREADYQAMRRAAGERAKDFGIAVIARAYADLYQTLREAA